MKKCHRCEKIKEFVDFWKDKRRKDGLTFLCKSCHKIDIKKWIVKNPGYHQKYRAKNRQKAKEATKRWCAENPQKASEATKKWRTKYPNKAKEKMRKDRAKTRSTPKGKLNHNISSAIWHSLKRGVKGGCHWENLVDFTLNQLKIHLEKLFTSGMTWENQGSYWHLDHKIPISAFNFEKSEDIDFKKCWCLKNLQPLEAMENMKKHAKINKQFQPSLQIERRQNPWTPLMYRM